MQITGGGKPLQRINTGEKAVEELDEDSRKFPYALVELFTGQTCMLYGEATALFICARP